MTRRGHLMRKLILSFCVIAASGVYVAEVAIARSGGVEGLVDRVTLRSPAITSTLDLDTSDTSGSSADDLFSPSSPPSRQP